MTDARNRQSISLVAFGIFAFLFVLFVLRRLLLWEMLAQASAKGIIISGILFSPLDSPSSLVVTVPGMIISLYLFTKVRKELKLKN